MKRKALWALIGVFLLGMGSGVLLDRAYLGFWGGGWRGGPEKRQARILGFLSRKLDLSDAQRAEIAPSSGRRGRNWAMSARKHSGR